MTLGSQASAQSRFTHLPVYQGRHLVYLHSRVKRQNNDSKGPPLRRSARVPYFFICVLGSFRNH